jgi:hypothetical protein
MGNRECFVFEMASSAFCRDIMDSPVFNFSLKDLPSK